MQYSYDACPGAEATIGRHQALIAEAVSSVLPADVLKAIVMIGGYGRDEGGYVQADDGSFQPYNDYDYFLVLDNVSRRQARELIADLPHLDDAVGIEVDFHPLLVKDLPHLELSLMNAEMAAGHRVIWGDPDILRDMPEMPLCSVPLAEFSRMMVNRGCLLLMNYLNPQRKDFSKYINKNYLAIGDARLALAKINLLHYQDKREMLAIHTLDSTLTRNYGQAIDARFRPDRMPAWPQSELPLVTGCWLNLFSELESLRLDNVVSSSGLGWREYAEPSLLKHQGDENPWRNLGRCVLDSKLSLASGFALRHPRERIASGLPLLLSEARQLSNPAADAGWCQRARALLEIWQRYS